MKFAVVLGSTRPGRTGEKVARWVMEQTEGRAADYELVDLADFDLPLLAEPTVPGAAGGTYEVPQTQRWSDTIRQYDGYVFVTAEYNHSVPAALKNAFDVLGGTEWGGKVFGLVGYGANEGVRSVEHWRQIIANLQGHVVRHQVGLSTMTEVGESGLEPQERRAGELAGLLDQMEDLTRRLRK